MEPDLLAKAEARFLRETGVFAGTLNHLEEADRRLLIVEAIGNEALTTSAIEDEILDRASVQSSIRKQFGFSGDLVRSKPGGNTQPLP
jgi:hypothetical protein